MASHSRKWKSDSDTESTEEESSSDEEKRKSKRYSRKSDSEEESSEEEKTCRGFLSNGETCSNNTKADSGYCDLHSFDTDLKFVKKLLNTKESKKDKIKCKGLLPNAKTCSKNSKPNSDYCHLHSSKTDSKNRKNIKCNKCNKKKCKCVCDEDEEDENDDDECPWNSDTHFPNGSPRPPPNDIPDPRYFFPKEARDFFSNGFSKDFYDSVEKKKEKKEKCLIENCVILVKSGQTCSIHTPKFDSSVDQKIIDKFYLFGHISIIPSLIFFGYGLSSIKISSLIQKEKWKKMVLIVHPDKEGGSKELMADAIKHRDIIKQIFG